MLPHRISILVALAAGIILVAAEGQAKVTRVEADKSAGTLVFFDGEAPVASFRPVFGSNPARKLREGDRATPVGRYTLQPARASRTWNWFMFIDYPNAEDQATGRTGSDIGLHGTGWNPFTRVAHWLGFNWTAGCIAVTNAEIDKIRALVSGPVPIEIRP